MLNFYNTLPAKALLLALVSIALCAATFPADLKESDVTKENDTKIIKDDDYRLPDTLKPEAYNIRLNISRDGTAFDGNVKIKVKVLKETNEIKWHKGPKLNVNVRSIAFQNKTKVFCENITYDSKTEMEKCRLKNLLKENEEINISLTFDGDLRDDMIGFYRSTYIDEKGKEKWVAATQFESTHARHAFPCFDEPALKAKFTIKISRSDLPEGYHCLSNMPKAKKSNANYFVFEESIPMSTYLVAFVISDFKDYPSSEYESPVSVRVWTRSELVGDAEYAHHIAVKCLDFFNRTLNEPYHLKKMDLVAVPDFSAGAMENWGLLTFRESNLLYDEAHSTDVAKQRLASVVVHECAHMWFGNLVTPKWWGSLWLSEGFARYYQYMGTAQCEKGWQMEEQFVVEQHQTAMAVDALNDSEPMTRKALTQSEIGRMGDSITYNKGACILRMIEQTFGTEVFESALRDYISEKKFDNASPEDLWKALQKQIDLVKKEDKINVTKFMKPWTEEPGFPYVKVQVEPDRILLSQNRFFLRNATDIDSKTVWTIPISLLSSTKKKISTKPVFWLTAKESELKNANEDADWLILNVNSSGFYRVLYDDKSWEKIIDTLINGDFEKIPVLNRAAIVDDLMNFARAGLVNYDTAFSALLYLKKETNYLPFKSAFTSLDYLIKKFSAHSNYELFKEYVFSLFSNVYEELTYDDKENDNQLKVLLRQEINNRACNLDHSDCVIRSKKYFSEWQKSGKPIPKNQRSAAYCTAIRHGTDEIWEFLYQEYKKSKVATEQLTILNALGCSKNFTKLEKYLLIALNPNYNESLIRKQDMSSVFSAVYSSLEGAEFMLNFIETQTKAIERYYKSYDEIGSIISGVLKNYPIEKLVTRVEKMMENSLGHLKNVMSSVKKSLELARFELNWFNKHSNTIVNWIKKKNLQEDLKNYRLPPYQIPVSYSISLSPKFEPNFTFDGRVEIITRIVKNTSKIVLHADQLEIDRANVLVTPYNANSVETYSVKNTTYNEKYHFFTIELMSPIEVTSKESTYINITISYSGYLNTEMRGFYRSSYDIMTEKRWLAATHLEPVGARRVFPCFDEPALKATFNITVVAPSKKYKVISNTDPKTVKNNTWEFETTPLMSTYLVAVVVSDFKGENSTDNKYRVWANPLVHKQASYSLSVMKPIVEDFEKRLKNHYHLKKLEMVALPDFSSGAMENWGLITFRETNMLYDPKKMSSLVAKQSIRNVISHEIAHQWFGNLVSPLWWDYVWLNEGFARYFQYFQYTEAEDSWNLKSQFVVDHLHTSFGTDALSSTHPITNKVYTPSQIRSMFDTISYAKAASIIRMLEKLIGTEKFYSALYKYLDSNKYSSAEPSSLFSAFETVGINTFNVTEFMTNWTIQPGYPLVNANINGNKVTLTQKRFYLKPKNDSSKYSPFTYLIPITWASGKNPNFNDTQNVTKWLKGEPLVLEIPNADKDWVIFNVQQMGYYRVNYDEAAWRRIFAVLDSDNFTNIHEINRAMIINDLFNLARAGELSYDIVLAGTRYLRRETEYVPWKAARTGFSYLARRFAGHPTLEKAHKTYVLELLQPIFEKLQFDDKNNDKHTDILLRKLVLDWMCSLDDEKCIKKASDLLNTQRHKDFEIPPNQKTFAYCTAIRHGSEQDWRDLKKKFEKSIFATEKINILTALGCSKDPELLKIILSDIIKNGSDIRLQDAQKVFSYVIDGSIEGVSTTLDFIENNYVQMYKYFGDNSTTKSVMSTISKRLSTMELLKKFERFVRNEAENMPSITKSLQTSLSNALYEMKWYKENSVKILKSMDTLVENNYRLPKNVEPINYEINLDPYFEERNFTFDGKTIIKIKVLEATHRIIINAHKLKITKITLDNKEPSNEMYNEFTQQLFIYFDEELDAEREVFLSFEYVGQLRNDMRGFYRSSYIDKDGKTKWIASTQFEPTYARSAFPCFDEPSFKATFKINIARPFTYHTLSNMGSNPTQKLHKQAGRMWDEYDKTVKMSTYLVAFVVSDFVKETASNSKVAVWARKELKDYCTYASEVGNAALKLLETKLNYTYELPEMNFVSIPDFDMGAMENWGLVTFREYGLSYDIQKISATYRRYVNTVVSHELVHMWFGNLVTLDWWDYTWLNEGFAEYVSHVISHETEKTWELLKQYVVNELHVALDVDAAESSHPMNNNVLKPVDIQSGFDKIAYQKAGSVLRMLHNSFGDKEFFEVLQNYMKNNHHKNTRPEHLIREFEGYYSIANKSVIKGNPKVNVTTIMNSWVTQAGYPVVNASRKEDKIEFSQERFLVSSNNASAKDRVYWTPITYTTETEKDFDIVEPKFWLGENKEQVSIKQEDKWFIVNVQEIGYYRVNYDTNNWERLIEVLNSDNFKTISDLNRAQIIDDSLNLARAGYIDYHIALNATKYLSRETSYYSWKAFFNAIAYLSQRVENQPEIKSSYTRHILALTSRAYDAFRFNENTTIDAHLDQLTRELIWSNACKYGNAHCIQQAKIHFKSQSITPNIASAVYCTAIEHGTEKDWDTLWNKFQESVLASDYITILKGLGCSKDSALLERYLDLALQKDSLIRKQDFKTAISSIYTSSQIGLETFMKYLVKNAEKFYQHYDNWDEVGALFTGLAGRISTREQIEVLKMSISNKNLSNIKSSLVSAIKTAENNLKWFEKYSPAIHTWFKENYIPPASMFPPTPEPARGDATAISIKLSILLLDVINRMVLDGLKLELLTLLQTRIKPGYKLISTVSLCKKL